MNYGLLLNILYIRMYNGHCCSRYSSRLILFLHLQLRYRLIMPHMQLSCLSASLALLVSLPLKLAVLVLALTKMLNTFLQF